MTPTLRTCACVLLHVAEDAGTVRASVWTQNNMHAVGHATRELAQTWQLPITEHAGLDWLVLPDEVAETGRLGGVTWIKAALLRDFRIDRVDLC